MRALWKRNGVALLACGVLVVLQLSLVLHIARSGTERLKVSFLDVGQGDAIFIEGPTGIQLLVDGGPDRSVIRELARVMSPLDRHIDAVVATHPDKDHIAGLSDVFARYRISHLVHSGRAHDTGVYEELFDAVAHEQGLLQTEARLGMRFHLGGGAYADVLYPDRDVSRVRDTNDASVVLRVVYGSTAVLLTGDLSAPYEERIVASAGTSTVLVSTVLKAGHHGSKYSTGDVWLKAVHPGYVVISAGKDNSYGHPSPEVLERVQKVGAQVVSTVDRGTITFVSDGNSISLDN